jgi:predicted nucleotidyltransferase
MKTLNYKELIAYASAFVSFILPKIEIKEIILFGSIARQESGKESDIDLFFNTEEEGEEKKAIINRELERFYKSKIAEVWFLKGVKNIINVHIGNLDEWKLKRSIISDGVLLYGKYKETPKNLKSFVLFNIEPIKNITKRNKIIRKLFGRMEKNYIIQGLVQKFNGKKLSPSSFIIKQENSNEIIDFLGKEKISYKFFELWTDQIV